MVSSEEMVAKMNRRLQGLRNVQRVRGLKNRGATCMELRFEGGAELAMTKPKGQPGVWVLEVR